MKAERIFRLVSASLQDLEPGVEQRWSWEGDCESIGLADYLNAVISAIALYRPELFAVTESVRLEPGMRQKLPVSRRHGKAVMLIDVSRNMGEGDWPGSPIQSVNQDVLMAFAQFPSCGDEIESWAYDRVGNPEYFLVWPPAGNRKDIWVEATFSVSPRPVKGAQDEIPLADCYGQALVHYMLAQIMAGDNDSSNYGKAMWHAQQFASLLGIKNMVDFTWPKAFNSKTGTNA